LPFLLISVEPQSGQCIGFFLISYSHYATPDKALKLLEDSLTSPRLREVPEGIQQRLSQSVAQDVAELIPHLDRHAELLAERAQKILGHGERRRQRR
jgi:hypothetical protein